MTVPPHSNAHTSSFPSPFPSDNCQPLKDVPMSGKGDITKVDKEWRHSLRVRAMLKEYRNRDLKEGKAPMQRPQVPRRRSPQNEA
ncbi:hypothetical protein AVEN_53414-1 [Araneus ventricosus]|uniref:Uncharacterized protein n=1 Tax=Araneus ventricosus TaxID=182803 RepID=A0A4Y2AA76_ARAVE|nr:hypothetical protein AVEN_53414-1 [Araneus ventricosus]